MESEYGFQNREDFQKAKLLDPMNIIFPTSEYYDNELVDSTKVNLFPSNNWKIPIVVDNNICCFLQGILDGNTFKVVSIGGKDIAQKLNTAKEKITNYNKVNYDLLLFPEIKRMFLLHNHEMSIYQSKCISFLDSQEQLLKKEQSLFETLVKCKANINQLKLRTNEY